MAKKKKVSAQTVLQEMRAKSLDELKKKVVDLKKGLMNLRFQKASQQLEKSHGIRLARRDVARTQTIIREKALEALQDKKAEKK